MILHRKTQNAAVQEQQLPEEFVYDDGGKLTPKGYDKQQV
jgi:hypothetical protein